MIRTDNTHCKTIVRADLLLQLLIRAVELATTSTVRQPLFCAIGPIENNVSLAAPTLDTWTSSPVSEKPAFFPLPVACYLVLTLGVCVHSAIASVLGVEIPVRRLFGSVHVVSRVYAEAPEQSF